VHLVGFTIELYHDARSHERQIYADSILALGDMEPFLITTEVSNHCFCNKRQDPEADIELTLENTDRVRAASTVGRSLQMISK
jgi:hypothetical protein